MLVYQPQVASWENQKHLVAYSAVSQRAKAGDKPAIGTIKIEAETQVSLTERLVSFQKMKIVEANFQTLQKEQVRRSRPRSIRRFPMTSASSRSTASLQTWTRARSSPRTSRA